jgi:adenylyltransferase/sulfurtransferase
MKGLSEPERKRYHRHLILEEIGEEGQIKLKNAKVLVVGAGGLGCPVMQYLASTGIGLIGVADNDLVDLSNLQRQVFYGFDDIGKMKAIVAGARIKRINSIVDVRTISTRLSWKNALKIISEFDMVADCTDNIESRLLLNDACIIQGIPMIHAAVHKFQGQVTVFNYRGGPTYRCLHPMAESETAEPGNVLGIYSVIPGIIGLHQANEIIKVITGMGSPLSGKLLIFNALNNQFVVIDFAVNPENFIRDRIISRFN